MTKIDRQLRILGIDCSPHGPGRTGTALEAVLSASAAAGAATSLIHLGGEEAMSAEEACQQMLAADAFALGSPMYRATFAAPFKVLLDATPRGMWGETEAPLTGRAVAIVATAASAHHFLGLGRMRDVLVDFFAAHVLSPGVYVEGDDFDGDGLLRPEAAEWARLQGEALVELGIAITVSRALRAITPQH